MASLTNKFMVGKNKTRYGMVLMKYDRIQTFICAYCNKEKTSRNIAFEEANPDLKICNACYGERIAKYEKN